MGMLMLCLHLGPCVQRPGNDECFGNAVDPIRKCPGVLPIPESDCLGPYCACADADCEDEEDNERQHFDPAGVSSNPALGSSDIQR